MSYPTREELADLILHYGDACESLDHSGIFDRVSDLEDALDKLYDALEEMR